MAVTRSPVEKPLRVWIRCFEECGRVGWWVVQVWERVETAGVGAGGMPVPTVEPILAWEARPARSGSRQLRARLDHAAEVRRRILRLAGEEAPR